MSFLKLLEGIRVPFLDLFFSKLTLFGEETLFMVVGLVCFWCVSKQLGRYLLNVGLGGTVMNQWLKLIFRVPRPWVRDPEFTIVESARAGAGGYSFPSGHTQVAVGTFGGIARWTDKRWICIPCIVIAVLVPFSRMYLGVHYPSDVLVGAAVSLALVLSLYPLMAGPRSTARSTRWVLLATCLLSLAYLVYVHTLDASGLEGEALTNLNHGVSNAWTLMGCSLGMWGIFELDERWVHFDTKAVWWAQLLKIGLGVALVLGVRVGVKKLLGSSGPADMVRYLLIVLLGGGLYPMSFKWFAGLGKGAGKTE